MTTEAGEEAFSSSRGATEVQTESQRDWSIAVLKMEEKHNYYAVNKQIMKLGETLKLLAEIFVLL